MIHLFNESCQLVPVDSWVQKEGTSFAAQTVPGNAIHTVVDQGIQRAEVMLKGPSLRRDTTL